jgi:segregation and condensation protein B
MIENHYKQVLETALLCSPEPLSINELSRLYGDEVTPENIITWLHELQGDWSQKGMELVHIATGWRFQSRLSMREYLDRMTVEKPPKYSRAVMETLAIIAYRQPVTRGEIEEIRGVTVSSQIIRQLEDRHWIEVIGHKDSIGRPALYATTKQFLDDMSIPNLQSLPSLEDGVVVDQIAQQVINFEQTLLDESSMDNAMEEEAQNLSTEHDSNNHEASEDEEVQHPELEEKKPNND